MDVILNMVCCIYYGGKIHLVIYIFTVHVKYSKV